MPRGRVLGRCNLRVRELEPRDIPRIKELHALSGFDYELPDLLSNEFERVTVVVDENDVPQMWIAARRSIELFLGLDPQWRNPRWRLDALMLGHEDMRAELEWRGWKDVVAFLPPEVEKSFGRRLERLFYWAKGRWQHYSRRTEAIGHEQRRNQPGTASK